MAVQTKDEKDKKEQEDTMNKCSRVNIYLGRLQLLWLDLRNLSVCICQRGTFVVLAFG